jgi:tetratricopeptide (TPR) repeat protein
MRGIFILVAAMIPLMLAACDKPVPKAASAKAAVASEAHSDDQSLSPGTGTRAILFDDLAGFHHPVTFPTSDKAAAEQAQKYFDQGMLLIFAFNHPGAIDSFKQALNYDPGCAMCWWGIALALGPNINAPMDPADLPEALEAVQKANQLAPKTTRVEKDYIAAVTTRYGKAKDQKAHDADYAAAMAKLHARYPGDLDAATLYAEALMDLTPWDYWTAKGAPREHSKEIVAVLNAVLARNPMHLGANHYLIHALEEFQPKAAEAAADRLAGIAPVVAGHLIHMPAHIYWRLGRYADAEEINRRAALADELYFARCGINALFREGYHNHNIHFIWSAAMMEGRSKLATAKAHELSDRITADMAKNLPFLEEFAPMPLFTMLRFGEWKEILATPAPDKRFLLVTGIWHYARGLAFVRLNRLDEAGGEYKALSAMLGDPKVQALTLNAETGPVAKRLRMALDHLGGEMALARGDAKAAVSALEAAVRAQDTLKYTEPPAWYFPTREALGAVLMKSGDVKKAEQVYRTDLAQYPDNGWSLYGLMQSLVAQGRKAEAQMVEARFKQAWRRADVTLKASSF